MTREEIRLIRSLDGKRERLEAGLFVAEGEKLVRELLASDFRVRKVFFTGGDFTEGTCECECIPPREMERASHLKTPTGCLALVEIPASEGPCAPLPPDVFAGRLVMALDGVQNPGNMGTIIRLADWFGIKDIVCSADSADRFNPKVVQATMGAITRVRVRYGDLGAMIAGAGVPVYGTFLEGENIYRAHLSPEGIVVLGNEGKGISPEVARLVDRKLCIPGCGSCAESLNVAIAGAITVSEFRRRDQS